MILTQKWGVRLLIADIFLFCLLSFLQSHIFLLNFDVCCSFPLANMLGNVHYSPLINLHVLYFCSYGGHYLKVSNLYQLLISFGFVIFWNLIVCCDILQWNLSKVFNILLFLLIQMPIEDMVAWARY